VQKLTTLLKKPLVLVAIGIFFFLAWLAFRPELLFVNKSVDEPFPTEAPKHASFKLDAGDRVTRLAFVRLN